MKPAIVLLGALVLLIAACEIPIDAENQTQNESQTPVHIEEVKNESVPPPQPQTPPLTPPPVQPAPPPSPTPPPEPQAPTPLVQTPLPQAAAQPQVNSSPPEVNSESLNESLAPGPQSPPSLPILQDPRYTAPLPPEAAKLLVRSDEKVKSYDFMYAPPPDNIPRDHYFIKGTRVKVELFEQGWFDPNTHKTAVYIDTQTKTASGYCEDNRITHCPNPARQFPVSFEAYTIKTPYQWLKEISYGKASEGEKISDRVTKKIVYTKGNALYEQWLDTFSGLPLRVKVTNATGQYTFNFMHMNINSVTDDVFVH